ncbi:MAG: DUF2793 domain-containing protein [Boseongicola sp.]|nr:DUF2793 domain-containing protein [Boseongicola sp.]MDD9976591.1 DUF2793 domain-containing protein [Boseongicola sp.]
MSETSTLKLPLVQPAQSQKHVTVNEAFLILDALTAISLIEPARTAVPASPLEGDLYGVGVGASGEWLGQDTKLALFANGGWIFVPPKFGWRAWLQNLGTEATFDGEGWIPGAGAMSENGAAFSHRSLEVDHAVSVGSTSVVSAFIPANSIVYGVTGRVLTDVGGASSFQLGVSGSTDRYGSGIGLTNGSWLRGITSSPVTYYSDTDLLLTAENGSFDGTGSVRLAVHFAELSLPRV